MKRLGLAAIIATLLNTAKAQEWNGEQYLAQAEEQKTIEVQEPNADAKARKTLEEQACPEYQEIPQILANGAKTTFKPLIFCYHQERGTVSGKKEELNNVQVYYTIEGTVRKDPWSPRQGYPRLLRQIIVSYETNGKQYAIRLITDPKADGGGLTDKVGRERLDIEITQNGQRETNTFEWYHGESGGTVEYDTENKTMNTDAYGSSAAALMRYIRKRGYDIHETLKGHYVFNAAKKPNESPDVLTDRELVKVHRKVAILEQKAEQSQ